MQRTLLKEASGHAAALALALGLSSCGSSEDRADSPARPSGPVVADAGPSVEQKVTELLDQRKFDFGEALRTASLKLRDELPSLDEIKQISGAADQAGQKAAYEALIDRMLQDPKLRPVMIKFWQDTFRTGQVGAPKMGEPNKDAAAIFAARVTVEGRSFSDVLTAPSNTCPTYDATANAFVDGSCATTPTSGILTDPGILAQYYSNMAFRRVRFVQETFACTKFQAEVSPAPVPMGNGTYLGLRDFTKIVGKVSSPGARIDFQDTSAVVCANCHSTMNGLAPLFIHYDANGALQATPQVQVPIPKSPMAEVTDYLVPGEPYWWRSGRIVTDIPSLGQAMVQDPDVAKCAVNRVWNFAMSRGDIVNDLAAIPDSVTASLVQDFSANGMKLLETIRQVFKSEDFTKF